MEQCTTGNKKCSWAHIDCISLCFAHWKLSEVCFLQHHAMNTYPIFKSVFGKDVKKQVISVLDSKFSKNIKNSFIIQYVVKVFGFLPCIFSASENLKNG